MNENSKLLKIGISIVVIALIIVVPIIIQNNKTSKLIKEIEDVMNSSDAKVIYMARPTCYYCNLLEPITDSLKEEYNLDYYYINTDELSNSELSKVLKLFDRTTDTFGTPYLIITKDGKVVAEQNGYADEDVIFNFFKTNGIIDEDETLKINYLDKQSFDDIMNNNEREIILIGKTGDESVVEARNELKEIITQYNLKINYFDIMNVSSEDEYNDNLEKLGYDEDFEGPNLVIVENNKIIAETNKNTKEDYITFLKNNSYIK